MIDRPRYISFLKNTLDKDLVKILVGVRRSGKSTLMQLLKKHLIESGISADRIIDINFEMLAFEDLKDAFNIHDYIAKRITDDQKYYLFIDEIQEMNDWAKIINSIRVTFNIDIYVTGSNARVFIGEHLTYLAGRYISLHVYPLSFDEMIRFGGHKTYKKDDYTKFLDSSFPALVLETDQKLKEVMQRDLFEAIFERDIILRGKIENPNLFKKVTQYVLEHIGTYISVNKIRNTLISEGIKISYEKVDTYLDLLTKAYFLYKCPRYNIKGKDILKTNGKYYVIDFGIRKQMIPDLSRNSGRILENFIYLELKKKGYEVFVGKLDRDFEIDFVAIKNGKRLLIQVSETILDPNTRAREVKPFDKINTIDERILVTQDNMTYTFENCVHMTLFDFIAYI